MFQVKTPCFFLSADREEKLKCETERLMKELENADEKQRKAEEMTVRWELKLTVTNKIDNFIHRNAVIGWLILSKRISWTRG